MERKKTTIKIEYIPISEIKEYENNPRDNEKAVDAVAKSIKTFGVRQPAILDKDNVIIAGHTRIKAALKLGMTEFPCVRADDLTKNEAKAYRLADNRIQEDSEWDAQLVAEEFNELKNNGFFDMSATGFDEFEIESLSYDFLTGASAGGEGDEPDDDPDDDDDFPTEDDVQPMDDEEEYEDDGGADDYRNDTFVCILCCANEADRQLVRELIGESGELLRHYTVAKIRQMREAGEND